MKAIRIHQTGGPEVLCFEDAPDPQPQAGQALVRVEAAGVNFVDVYFRTGLYKGPPLPFVAGQEGAGTVTAVGPGVAEVAVGDRVAWVGIHACLRPARRGAGGAPGQAAGRRLHPSGRRRHAAGDHRPLPGHQHLRAPGRRHLPGPRGSGRRPASSSARSPSCAAPSLVFATVSTEEKAAIARAAGADEVILYSQHDFSAEVKRLNGGRGVRVIYDGVGKATFEKGLDTLLPRGLMVLFGQASGPVPPFDLSVLNPKGSLYVTRPSMIHYIADREELMGRAGDVLGWIAAGKLRLSVDREMPLEQAADAHRALEGRETTGKVLLIP